MRISDWSSDVCSSDLTIFCVALGRQMPASDRSQPMSFGIDPSLRSTCKVAVFWNHRWLRLVLTRTWGDRSKSAPAPTQTVPGLLKFDCPSSFDERSELRMPLDRKSVVQGRSVSGRVVRGG